MIYIKQTANRWSVVVMDADGNGRKILPLPEDGYVRNLRESVSPDGKWLVFYTGPILELGTEALRPVDVKLNLMSLPDGKVRLAAHLLSPDYPDNLRKIAVWLREHPPSDWPEISTMSDLQLEMLIEPTFKGGIYAHSWSPDSRYLAYASEADGPSTDLYIYDMTTQGSKRLSDGPQNIEWIDWAPDGKRIVHKSAFFTCVGDCSTYYVATLDDRPIKTLPMNGQGRSTVFATWVNSSQYAIYSIANGMAFGGYLRYVDIDADRIIDVYPHAFGSMAFDPQDNVWVVSTDPDSSSAVYSVGPVNGFLQTIIGKSCPLVLFVGLPKYRFLANCEDGSLLFTVDGAIIVLKDTSDRLPRYTSTSPNREMLLLYDSSSFLPGMELYTAEGKLVRRITDLAVSGVTWKPDSLGLFFVSGKDLYYYRMPDGKPVLVDGGLQDDRNFDLIWIEGK